VWMIAAIASALVTRSLWAFWNVQSMDDVRRGVSRVRPPVYVFVAVFIQSLVAAAVFLPVSYAALVGAVPAATLLVAIASAQYRVPPAAASSARLPDERSTSSLVALQSVFRIVSAVIVVVGLMGAYSGVAFRVRDYLWSSNPIANAAVLGGLLMTAGLVLLLAARVGLQVLAGDDSPPRVR
jgi:hypothetical protein